MFWELYQLSEIHSAKTTAVNASARAGNAEDRLMRLEHRIEGLTLACQALWEISSDELNVTKEQLVKKMEEVDLRDGKLDGRMRRQVQDCPDCGRKSLKQRKSCIYCGTQLPDDGHMFAI